MLEVGLDWTSCRDGLSVVKPICIRAIVRYKILVVSIFRRDFLESSIRRLFLTGLLAFTEEGFEE